MRRRNTAAKEEVLEKLKSAGGALSHDMLNAELASIDRATIYRILNRFSEDGLVHKIIGDDGKQYFALCINCREGHHHHNHFHFRCSNCGKVECLRNEVKVQLPAGYILEGFNGVISGICGKCAA